MKKILHIGKYYYPFKGGTEQATRDSVNALKDDYLQKVICFNHEPGDRVDIIDGIEIVRVGCFAKVASQSLSVSYGRKLKRLVREFKPDLILLQYPNPFATHYLLKYCPENAKLVIFWQLDIVKQKVLKLFFEGQNKRLLRRADLILASSPNYLEGSPYLCSVREKCRILPNCISVERLEVTDQVRELAAGIRAQCKSKTICFAVGRHTAYKGMDFLIRASRYLDDSYVIFIGGEGKETGKLEALAEGDDKIRFLGEIDDDMLKGYMLAADIFCFPSITKNEAFGISLAEAMYYRKPAVTFTIPGSGVNYVCLNGITGLEVPNRDIKAYAKAIRTLAEDPELRKNLGNNARRRVEENFLSSQYSEKVLEVIQVLEQTNR